MAALEKMPGHPRLYRRGAVYYHRAIVPKDIADTYSKVEETFSLKTKEHAEALRLVRVASVGVIGKRCPVPTLSCQFISERME